MRYNVLANGGGQLGYRCNKFRFEAEGLYNVNSIKGVVSPNLSLRIRHIRSGLNNGNNSKGSTSTVAGLGNVYYEFYDEDNSATTWVPYVGLGAGYASVTNGITLYNRDGVKIERLRNSKAANGYIGQAILGINYFFSDFTSLGTDIRVLSVKNVSEFNNRMLIGTWNVVWNYTFDQPGYY